jgi:hypothetical protein
MIPDWLLPTILLLPATLWLFVGVGLPWALAILPRAAWRRCGIVLAAAVALGPALTTAGMFVIGTVGRFSAANVLLSSALIAAVGVVLALTNRATTATDSRPADPPLTVVDGALIAVTVVAVLLRFWNTAYWPFATYDEFWVYGYNAKIFVLEGAIPTTMGYYPQLVPLSYTFTQLLWGVINDHAARTVVPFFALGSILMAYVGGVVSANHRAGLLAAAIWALYPQHGVWSQFGDLEVPLTLYFTGVAAFFVAAFRERQPRYAILSGLMLGTALWTKPTGAALVQSLGLIVAVGLFRWWRTRSRPFAAGSLLFRYGLLTLIVAAPLGGMWYVRNVLLGHVPVVFPAGYWQAEAQRSGQELGWPLLIALALAVLLILRWERPRAALIGAILLTAGIVPSAVDWALPSVEQWTQMLVGQIVFIVRPPDLSAAGVLATNAGHVLRVIGAWLAIVSGVACLGWAALPTWRRLPSARRGYYLLLAAFVLPYGVTWFWSYSYHFRLSFAIVPLLINVLAGVIVAVMDALPPPPTARLLRAGWRLVAVMLIIVLALPGQFAVLSALPAALQGVLPDDEARMAYGNPALMQLVGFLRTRQADLGRPLKLVAPGELRLRFFFPDADVRGDLFPTRLDEVADVDYFIDSSPGQRLYDYAGTLYNQILRSLTRTNAMQRDFTTDDGNFRFSAYRILNQKRFETPPFNGPLGEQIGEVAVLAGYDLGTAEGGPGTAIFLTLYFRALAPADREYSLFVHIWDPKAQRLIAEWSGQPMDAAYFVWYQVPGEHFDVSYSTTLWQAGEYVIDDRRLVVPDGAPPGDYELRVGLFDPISGERLPVRKDEQPAGDSVRLYSFRVK